jgi:hypothetical protein
MVVAVGEAAAKRILTQSFWDCWRACQGDVWPEAERKLWLELLSGSFKLIYKDKDEAAN